jgi:ABC-type bacteriocin/lantibiotic exporter with double-glycine peptidase domain
MVLGYLGDDVTEAHLAQVMGSYWYGTPARRVRRLSSLGYQVTYEQTNLDQLRVYLDRQVPCIVFVRTVGLPYWDEDVPHAVVLAGIENTAVYLHDPAMDSGPTIVDLEAFLLAWSEMAYYCATIERG